MAEATLGVADPATAVPATPPASVPNDGKAPVANPPAPAAPTTPAAEVKLDVKAGDAKPALPEKYELKGGDGNALHPLVNGAFGEIARAAGWDGAAAQKNLDALVDALRKANETPEVKQLLADRDAAQKAATHAEWSKQSRADKEFGGANLDANLAIGVRALKQFGSDALYAWLDETGLNKHPEFIRFAYRVGKATSGDRIVKGEGTNGPGERKPLANRLVPNGK